MTGHLLEPSEGELLVYDSICEDATTVRFQDVLLGRDRLPLVIPREQLDVVLVTGGGLSFQLHPDFADVIEDALALEEPEEEPEEDVDEELEGLDSHPEGAHLAGTAATAGVL